MKKPCVYILSNPLHTVLYVGVTSDIIQRIIQHRNRSFGGFSARYNLMQLLYVEEFGSMTDAIAREKQIKSWSRKRKDALIATTNPLWLDLMAED